jgi:hypothetical protein
MLERSVGIYRQFKAKNGYQHPHWDNVLWYYKTMFQAAGLADSEIESRMSGGRTE